MFINLGVSEMRVIDGWIPVEEDKPPFLEGKDYSASYSANVWGCDEEGNVLIVSYFNDGEGYFWANACGNIFGTAEFDDDYDIRYWQPIIIPQPPKREKS